MPTPLVTRRDLIGTFLASAAAACAASAPRTVDAAGLRTVYAEAERRRAEGVQRLQEWIRQPSIAAESRGMQEGCDLTMRLARDAGFGVVERIPTDGHPGVFAMLDAGAPRTVGLYFMYDVKQVDPPEWSSPPSDAALVDSPSLGKAVIGRGAVNQKGPQAAFLAALHAIRGAGKKLPVNLVLVAEGEEEVGSTHLGQIVHHAARAAPRSRSAWASSCPTPRRRSTAPWASTWAPRAISSSSSSPAPRSGAAARRPTFTRARRRESTARRGDSYRRSRR